MLVTPNIPEAQVIVGHSVVTDDDVRQAAMEIHALGAANVLMKGGHREGDALDLLYDGREFHAFSVPRIATKHTHGTGCTFSAAIAAGLAKGLEMLSAVGEAKAYVTAAIAAGEPIGQGISPVRHFYRWW
jgi:hydroxymethylpyrimidine/phosphomethylpyrimidine kinase